MIELRLYLKIVHWESKGGSLSLKEQCEQQHSLFIE